jgi:putative hydrolase of the HAD superfamily
LVPSGIEAVLLDIGGVMLIPDIEVLSAEFAEFDYSFDVEDFWRAHYFGMAALDEFGARPGAWAEGYVEGVLNGLRVTGSRRESLGSVFTKARRLSDSALWRWPVPGSFDALREFSEGPAKVAFVSNSDGSAEHKLISMGLCQVGPGAGIKVDAIFDSAVVGIAKPDPAIFNLATGALGVDPGRTVFVGDSLLYDVAGARAANLIPLHFDPFMICAHGDHEHLANLKDLAAMIKPREEAGDRDVL